jgi:hypothetical protein
MLDADVNASLGLVIGKKYDIERKRGLPSGPSFTK